MHRLGGDSALLFECTPGLSGRLGDLLYLFVWTLSIPVGLESWKPGGHLLGRMLDFTGLGFAVSQVQRIAGTGNFTVGFSPTAVHKPPVLFTGLDFPPETLLDRALGLAAPLLLAPLALFLFRRFDPARTRRSAAGGRLALPVWLQNLAGRLIRPLFALPARLLPDAALTFRIRPMLALVVPVFAVLGLALPIGSVGPRQASEKRLPGAMARVVCSATCSSAEFLYPTGCGISRQSRFEPGAFTQPAFSPCNFKLTL